jgi:uncharacterized SAM-binding protein YcdF (DUF218 family)
VGAAVVVTIAVATTYGAWRIWQRGDVDEARAADAIVVLGAAQYDGRPSPVFEARLRHAVDLYQQGLARILVVTGGSRDGDRTTEAAAARSWAEAHGVPAAAILGEDGAHNTKESLDAVAAILGEHGLRSAIFVSDRTHMLRVIRMAKDLGIDAYGSPTTTSPVDASTGARLEATAHELGALLVYGLTGSGTADSSNLEELPAGTPASPPTAIPPTAAGGPRGTSVP